MSYWSEIIMLLFICMIVIKIVTSMNSQTQHYSLYRVTAFNSHERQVLYDMHMKSDDIIFLNGVTNDAAVPMDILVHEFHTEEFEMNLQDKSIEYINIDSDQIQEEFNNINYRGAFGAMLKPSISENFLDWNQITTWVDNSCANYVRLNKTIIGSTYEKRELLLLTLSTGQHKPAVFIMGGEQGRDWMSTAIILNFIQNLLEGQLDMLNNFDFYFMPVFNPDGYEYTMKHDRFWNKNRKVFFPEKNCSTDTKAVGVNIDRNWFLSRAQEVPDAECLSVYLGNRCLTEEETKSLSIFLNSIASNLLAFINLRGFESLITVPFADNENYSNNQAILLEMLLFACTNLKEAYNVTYKFSNMASCFYNFSGNVADWVKLKLNVPLVFTMYMEQEPYIFPHIQNIVPLSNQFTFMAQELLLLGKNIYGPLFSKQTIYHSNLLYVVLFCTLILFCL